VVEAHARGLDVVGTDVSDVGEILGSDEWVLPVGDVDAAS
jgi:hypothetical protein